MTADQTAPPKLIPGTPYPDLRVENPPRGPDWASHPRDLAPPPSPPVVVPAPPVAPVAAEPDLSTVLAQHAETQRVLAAGLRAKAAKVRSDASILVAAHAGQGSSMEPWRLSRQQNASADAVELDRRADRCELRARRADEGLLLHDGPENQDVAYLQHQGGYMLIRLARSTGLVVTS
jgi:hypothetical protein